MTPIYVLLVWDVVEGLFLTPRDEEVRRLEPVGERWYEYVPCTYSTDEAQRRSRYWRQRGARFRIKHYGWKQRGFRPGDPRLPDLYNTDQTPTSHKAST